MRTSTPFIDRLEEIHQSLVTAKKRVAELEAENARLREEFPNLSPLAKQFAALPERLQEWALRGESADPFCVDESAPVTAEDQANLEDWRDWDARRREEAGR
jgi:predicted nuclease with TOPRIM domain